MDKQSIYFEQYWDKVKGNNTISFEQAKEIFSSGWQQGIQETNEEILELLKAQVDCLISEIEGD